MVVLSERGHFPSNASLDKNEIHGPWQLGRIFIEEAHPDEIAEIRSRRESNPGLQERATALLPPGYCLVSLITEYVYSRKIAHG